MIGEYWFEGLNLVRALVINAVVIVTLSVVVVCIGRAGDLNFHMRELYLAAGVSFFAAEVALVPLMIARGKSQAIVAQAGLIGTVVHTFLCAGVGMAVESVLRTGQPLMYWLLLFYWGTLGSIAYASVRAVKLAPVDVGGLATK